VVGKLLRQDFDVVVASADWHPKDHISFAQSHGMEEGELFEGHPLWPVHCVQQTFGAQFPKELEVDVIDQVFYKGVDSDVDSYSAFFDNEKRRSTGLDNYLNERGVDTLFVVGLATDYCVKFTVEDALKLGFKVLVVIDGCAGVELQTGDEQAAIKAMRAAGATIVTSVEL